jgi:molybdopterin-containing oxidoreductase family membrane subunit
VSGGEEMKKNNFPLVLSMSLLVISLAAWVYQIQGGLIVTNMRNPFNWGLYIATFAFFVGIAAGGLIVSSSVYLFNLEPLKPFTRIASLTAFASTLGAMLIILPDLGRVDRMFQLFLHPNFSSPLVWDVVVLSTYLVITFLSVYYQLLPDWKPQSKEKAQKAARRVAYVGLPVAVLIHTVTALIFATQGSRHWWNTALLPPDFIAMAVASGTALVMVVMLLTMGKEGLVAHSGAFKILGSIIAGALVVHFFFLAVDLIIHGWWGGPAAEGLFAQLFGRYGALYAVELILLAVVMAYFVTGRKAGSYTGLLLSSLLLFAGVFIHRMMLMFPAFNDIPLHFINTGTGAGWSYPVALGHFQPGMDVFVSFWPYVPSPVEWAVALLPFGMVGLVIALALRFFRFLPERQVRGASVSSTGYKAPVSR